MVTFNSLPDDASALDQSPLVRAAHLTLQFAIENGGIELTTTKAFKRSYVSWAAEHFAWPRLSASELFRYSKVLNEQDFPPLHMLHFLLIHKKLGRHYKGRFVVTKRGRELSNTKGQIFEELIPLFLFEIDHASFSRFGEAPVGNWETWLNVFNVEMDEVAAENDLLDVFLGPGASFSVENWREVAAFTSCVLNPLEWAGLIGLIEAKEERGETQRYYVKTDLWRAALSLETDGLLGPIQRH